MNQATFASTDEQFRDLPLKKVVGKFATLCWLNELKINLEAKTIGDISSVIETVAPWNKTSIQRRWRTYETGQHKPVNRVLDLAEKQVPGSTLIFRSPLWDALRLDKSAIKVAKQLRGQTTKEGDELLEWLLDHRQTRKIDRWLGKHCNAMVFHASLESLAILTLCMRLAKSKGMSHWTLRFYRYATESLIILGAWFCEHGIAPANAEYYEKVLLPACYDEDASWCFRSSHYLYIVSAIAKAVLAEQEKARRNPTEAEVIAAMIKLHRLHCR